MAVHLPQLLEHCEAAGFAQHLKQALKQLPDGSLPLHLATTQGGMVDSSALDISLLHHHLHDDHLAIRMTVFFEEIVGGCNCHDDPVRVNGCCILALTIDRQSGLCQFSLADEASA